MKALQGEIWGGLSASALVLPQAMAFGIALWLPFTHDSAAAALSGLITAACLCLVSSFFFGTAGLISAPTGPTLVLLSGMVAALHATGLAGRDLVAATGVTVLLAGLLQLLIGVMRLGHLIKFIPYPVVSGFMTGSGILMVESQIQAVTGGDVSLSLGQGAWIPAATAAVTLAAIVLLPRWIRSVPGIALGLLCGTLAFHLFTLVLSIPMPTVWVVGHLPSMAAMHPGIALSSPASWPWLLMLGSALALAVLASLDTLLTSVVADISTGARHSAARTLMGQGVGHLLSSLLGGVAGAGTTGATLAAIESGGRRWVGLVTAFGLVLFIVLMAPLAAILPLSMLAGIILYIAVFSLLDKDIILWLKTPRARMDGMIALVVTAVTVFYDLMVAVALGVALAAIEFIRAQVQTAVIHRRWNAGEHPSLRHRPQKERRLLAEHADQIVGYELKGTLFFGTTDHLFVTIQEDLKRAKYIILDMRRVGQVDLTAIRLIEHMSGILRERGGELILTHVPSSMGLVKRKGHRHERVVPYHAHVRLRTFAGTDQGLEYAEDCLLRDLGVEPAGLYKRVELGDSDLLSGFNDEERAYLEGFFQEKTIAAGEYLFRSGDFGDELFVVLSGEVEILLPYEQKKKLRLAKFGPGMTVGEAAFLAPGPRTADARTTADCELAILEHEALKRLCRKSPELGMRLLLWLGHELSQSLRQADAELRRLAA